ncbi:MAG: PIN domain-containing protein [Micrococcales bacterium]|nr:PIN domain-containing protein [Micrococcales bacterium]
MGRRLILDTNLLIEIERGAAGPLDDDDDLAVAALTLAELERGVHSAKDARVAARRRRFVERVPHLVEVLAYTDQTAHEHAVLLAETAAAGRPRGAHDLIIAAHARETGRTILTSDRRARFDGLSNVRAGTLTSA